MSANVAVGTLQTIPLHVSETRRQYQPANEEISILSLLLVPTDMACVRVVVTTCELQCLKKGREGRFDHAGCIPFGLDRSADTT